MPQRLGVPRGLSAIVPLAVFSEVADTQGRASVKVRHECRLRRRVLCTWTECKALGYLAFLIAVLGPATAARRYDAGARIAGHLEAERCSPRALAGGGLPSKWDQRRRRGDPHVRGGSSSFVAAP